MTLLMWEGQVWFCRDGIGATILMLTVASWHAPGVMGLVSLGERKRGREMRVSRSGVTYWVWLCGVNVGEEKMKVHVVLLILR